MAVKRKTLYNIIIVILAAIFIFSAVQLGIYIVESIQAQNEYDRLNELMENNRPTRPVVTDPPQTDPTSGETAPIETTEPAPTEPQFVTVINPDTGESMDILPEFGELYNINPDLVGWIEIPGTDISYPVVQRKETTDYYLRRDFYGEYANHGCIYVREQCDVFEPTDNITIYGHRMRDGTMFAGLLQYKKEAYWQEHQTIYFDNLFERKTYEIVAVFRTTATLGEGFRYHIFVDAETEEEFNEYVEKCKDLAYYDTGVEVVYGDELITLSTCDYTITNGRFVVVAKRVS